ncbi:MAG: outer membrane beta-barrel protein [Paludibacter sp.]|nr:outer membrane beta-barrel protein [Paludibacter sp.]
MKRKLLIVLLILTAVTVTAQRDLTYKWSMTAEYGMSSLDGDGDSSIQPAYGVSVEYAFLAFAGVSVDYYYFPLRGPAFSTQLNAADLNLTVNLNRLFFSSTDYRVIVKGSAGYGIAGYSTKYTASTTPFSASIHTTTSSFPVLALSVEYYLNKALSLGVKSQFRPFNQNNLEGDPRVTLDNTSNDNLVAAALYLRVKFIGDN